VSCILEDERRNLWMSTNHGLSVFDPSKQHSKLLRADGLPGADLTDGRLFQKLKWRDVFWRIQWRRGISSGQGGGQCYVPPIVLTDFRLFDRPVTIGADSPLSSPSVTPDTESLS